MKVESASTVDAWTKQVRCKVGAIRPRKGERIRLLAQRMYEAQMWANVAAEGSDVCATWDMQSAVVRTHWIVQARSRLNKTQRK